ncbi:MAG: methyltransferase domain-containing protein [Planctomycetia bacterium]|nr:methyltransferase domain-containing protein [Planctomycetia bacterium]
MNLHFVQAAWNSAIRCACAAVLLALVATNAARAQDAAVEELPPALTHYQGREIAQTMHYLGADWLTRESRQREEDCDRMLAALKLQPGQNVCDLGCGNGFYTLPMAALVGEMGRVFAVDIQQEMLHLLDERAKDAGHANIEPVLGSPIDPRLPEGKLDVILLVDVYHEMSHPEQMLQAMRRALQPKGRLVLVEFRLEDPEVPIKVLHKMSKEQIKKELVPHGFRLVEEYDDLPWQHMMFFEPDAKEGTKNRDTSP